MFAGIVFMLFYEQKRREMSTQLSLFKTEQQTILLSFYYLFIYLFLHLRDPAGQAIGARISRLVWPLSYSH